MNWNVVNTGVISLEGGGADINTTWDNTEDGRILGTGTIRYPSSASGIDNRGVFSPGPLAPEATPGTLTVDTSNQNPFETGPGTLEIEIGGTTPGDEHDQLVVDETVQLSGTLAVRLIGGFTPEAGSEFAIVTAGTVAGSFDTVDLPSGFEIAYEPTRVILRAAGAGGPALADTPWPTLGGGVARLNQSPVEGPENVALEWEYDAEVGFGALINQPVLAEDGTIYTPDNASLLYAVNPDGSEKWRAETGGARSSPLVAEDGTVYVGSTDGGLYAVDPDGNVRWRFDAGDRINSAPNIAENGTIYVASNAQQLFAVNPDGTLRWSREIGGFGTSSPAVAPDGTVVVSSSAGTVLAFTASGERLWAAEYDGTGYAPTITPDGRVVLQTGGAVRALRPGDGQPRSGSARVWASSKRRATPPVARRSSSPTRAQRFSRSMLPLARLSGSAISEPSRQPSHLRPSARPTCWATRSVAVAPCSSSTASQAMFSPRRLSTHVWNARRSWTARAA